MINNRAVSCGMARLPSSSRPLAVAGILMLAVTVLCASCGGSPPSAVRQSTTTTSHLASTSTTTPAATAVLSAYRAEWKAFEQAAAKASSSDPVLAATMVNPLLQRVRRNLLSDHYAGIVSRGSFTLHPRAIAMTSTTATIVDCVYSTAKLVYAASGKPVPPVTPPEHDGVRSTLVLTGSAWKVATQSVTDGRCLPGY